MDIQNWYAEEQRQYAEEVILSMADIIYENRRLRRELEEAKEYEKKYTDLLNYSVRSAREGSANLLKAALAGAFTTVRGTEEVNADGST